ncbi:MAG TPA: ABC transporter permease, partial [Pseudomonas sp.]|uniref:ABC transporter permease n=1 Tax=Pseudomonas sp. TaxID=306 RepID=UPI002EDA0CAF
MSNAYLAKTLPGSDDQPQPPMTTTQALAREERKENTSMLLLLAPALFMVVVLLILPMCWLAFQSVQTEEGFSLANYARIFQERIYWDTFSLTFKISFMVTILSIVLGFPIAYAASRLHGFWANLILVCVIIPFWTSVLVRSYAWLVLLQRRGLVNQTLMDLGIIDQPLNLMHNTTGTVIGTLHVMLPFMVLPLYSVMKKIPQDLLQASESLGAKPLYTFRRVFLPMAAPGIMAGSILVFVICLGFFITPELLGGGRTILVSMLVQRNV